MDKIEYAICGVVIIFVIAIMYWGASKEIRKMEESLDRIELQECNNES